MADAPYFLDLEHIRVTYTDAHSRLINTEIKEATSLAWDELLAYTVSTVSCSKADLTTRRWPTALHRQVLHVVALETKYQDEQPDLMLDAMVWCFMLVLAGKVDQCMQHPKAAIAIHAHAEDYLFHHLGRTLHRMADYPVGTTSVQKSEVQALLKYFYSIGLDFDGSWERTLIEVYAAIPTGKAMSLLGLLPDADIHSAQRICVITADRIQAVLAKESEHDAELEDSPELGDNVAGPKLTMLCQHLIHVFRYLQVVDILLAKTIAQVSVRSLQMIATELTQMPQYPFPTDNLIHLMRGMMR
jgi:hypothetical protein